MDEYVPSKEILDKYADVMINFALNGGEGVKPGEVVLITVPESARPFYDSLYEVAIKAGAHPMMRLIAQGNELFFYENATTEQLSFFPLKYYQGLIDQVDHTISVSAPDDLKRLSSVDKKKIFEHHKALQPAHEIHDKKEHEGKLFWTLCMYGTSAMAQEAGLSLKEYWAEIIHACYLDEDDPVAHWKDFKKKADEYKRKLDEMDIEYLDVVSQRTNLRIGLGKNRRWLGARCHNIPSFELFISPDWRETRGNIQFTEPLYRYGNLIENAYVEFGDDGCVKKATATQGEEVLLEMIGQENADKVGEFSMTDRRFSRITKFMAQTLFDENVGGIQGNTHIALGNAYKDSFKGDVTKVSEDEWKEMGFNESVIHTDIVSTEQRTITATLRNGEQKVIYKDGEFTL